jgi:hypothetical protein
VCAGGHRRRPQRGGGYYPDIRGRGHIPREKGDRLVARCVHLHFTTTPQTCCSSNPCRINPTRATESFDVTLQPPPPTHTHTYQVEWRLPCNLPSALIYMFMPPQDNPTTQRITPSYCQLKISPCCAERRPPHLLCIRVKTKTQLGCVCSAPETAVGKSVLQAITHTTPCCRHGSIKVLLTTHTHAHIITHAYLHGDHPPTPLHIFTTFTAASLFLLPLSHQNLDGRSDENRARVSSRYAGGRQDIRWRKGGRPAGM